MPSQNEPLNGTESRCCPHRAISGPKKAATIPAHIMIDAAVGPFSRGTHSIAAKRIWCIAALAIPRIAELAQNKVKLPSARAWPASRVAVMPRPVKARNVFLRPNRAIPRDAGRTPKAVPTTIKAMGIVANWALLANWAPIILPISISMGDADIAIALISASSQTILNSEPIWSG